MIVDKEVCTQLKPRFKRPFFLVSDDHRHPVFKSYDDKDTHSTAKPTEIDIRLSFQLMTCAEPADLVIASIKSLLAIKDVEDEIIIIDNNHSDKALYEPIASFCDDLDPKLNVRFYHIDAVAGFKSGALNLALGLMSQDSSHVVVVDSDYQALPHAREAIVTAIYHHPECALLQFPQFYRDGGYVNVHRELNHYFNYHLYRVFNRKRALSTGTYAVIRRESLLALGGWSAASITEDAQMGVLMHRHGMRSRFIPKVIATGLLPNTLPDLIAQRQRWIYGNAQVLVNYFSTSAAIGSDSVSKISHSVIERFNYTRAHFSQLGAWINFTGIFIILQIVTLLLIAGVLISSASIHLMALLSPLCLVYVAYAIFLARRLWAYSQDHGPLNAQMTTSDKSANDKRVDDKSVDDKTAPDNTVRQADYKNTVRTWLLHLNFWEFGALTWVPVLWGRDKPFICTPKLEQSLTRQRLWQHNILALPKLLLILNVITALLTAPFSLLYAPVIFGCAVTICVLKIWAASVAFDNYSFKNIPIKSTKPLTLTHRVQQGASKRIKDSLTSRISDENTANS